MGEGGQARPGQFWSGDLEVPVEGARARAPVSGAPIGADETTLEDGEQEQYDDFTTRALSFIYDKRSSGGPNKSPRDAIIAHMAIDSQTVPQAVGRATADVCFLIHNNAKRNQVEYSADVIFAGAQEVISALYELGTMAGIFDKKKLPPEDSPEEEQLLGRALMYATEYFGKKLQATGQNPQAEAMEHLNSQMQREAETGELDSWDPRSELDADGIAHAMNKMRQQKDDPVTEMEKAGYPRMVDTGA